jgi:hypothetical protein
MYILSPKIHIPCLTNGVTRQRASGCTYLQLQQRLLWQTASIDRWSRQTYLHLQHTIIVYICMCVCVCACVWGREGRNSAVGIAICYGLDGPGSNPSGAEIFRACSDRSLGPPRLLYNGYRVFPGVKAAGVWRWGHPPHPEPRLEKE